MTTDIKVKIQYISMSLDSLGYIIAIGRYLFPLFLILLALHYSMIPYIRRHVWVTSSGYAEENPSVLERFTKGLYKAMDYRVENLEEVAKWVAEQSAVSEESVLEQINDGDWTTAAELLEMIEDGTMEALYQKQAENFVEAERITEDDLVPVSDYVLFDIMIEAGK